MRRREFLALLGAGSAAASLGCRRRTLPVEPPPPREPPTAPPASRPASLLQPDHPEEVLPPAEAPLDNMLSGIRQIEPKGVELVEVSGRDAAKMVRTGLEAIGGMRRFVSRGDRVVLSPNFAWARPAGSGVTTDPAVVHEVILLCQEAGAREVICIDNTTDEVPRAYRVNGAYRALDGTRARLLSPASAEQHVRVGDFNRFELHRSRLGWQAVPQDLLRCETFISLPVFKHHREVKVTGAIKKQMGCIWRREAYHKVDLPGCIAELAAALRPTLVVTDARQILTTNGPDGPGKAKQVDRLLVGLDPVLADAYACRYLDLEPGEVPYLERAERLGAGSAELRKDRIEHVVI